MKGFIFSYLVDFVEESFGLELVDELISEVDLPSKGVYVSFESYEFSELVALVSAVSVKKNVPVEDLLEGFGRYVFPFLISRHDYIITDYSDPLELIAGIENHIHIEVRKLYDDAELPSFKNVSRTENKLIINYTSQRELAHFAIGLIKETLGHFNKKGAISMEKLNDQAHTTQFIIEVLES